jgi:hypothetical protein
MSSSGFKLVDSQRGFGIRDNKIASQEFEMHKMTKEPFEHEAP